MKNMKNYRVAFFTVDWNYELVEKTLHGLRQYVADHENVSLHIFDCFGKDVGSAKDQSEYAIFDLADLSLYDGLLIQGNQIVLNSAREKIVQRVAEAGIPAVTIDCPLEGCTLVGIDNALAQHDIAEHVIREHGAKRFVYLTGLLENGCPEAKQRRDGFLDACRENGIPDGNIEVIPCTWRTDDGVKTATRWIKEQRPLPDAFVCGNDEMALGVISVLTENGYHIPDDVIVTGFDNVESAELSSPRLSTVSREYDRLNYFAMDVLIRKINGEEERSFIPFEYGIVCSESCGCREQFRPDYIRDRYFSQSRFLKNFYILQDELAGNLFEAEDLAELMIVADKKQTLFGTRNVFLCINDYYYDNYEKAQWNHDAEKYAEEMVLALPDGNSPSENRYTYLRFPTHELLPQSIMKENRFLIFYPLHYNTYSIGYVAMNDLLESAKLNLHESIFNFLEIAIENVRKKCLLRQMNKALDDLYIHDALTGLYNRFGFKRFGQQVFDRLLSEDGKVQILFIDMDGLKLINDRFGHEAGDLAVRSAARILETAFRNDDFLMRYGGDEFLVISSCCEKDPAGRIQDTAASFCRENAIPFQISFSVGIIISDLTGMRTLEECVQEADVQMYQIKAHKKGKTTAH